MPFARTREGMIILGDVFWGRVSSCRADGSVVCRVGGAAVALITWARAPPHHGGGVRCLIATHTSGGSRDVQTLRYRRMSLYTSAAAVVAARVCGCMTMDDGPWNALMMYTLLHTHTLPVTGPLVLSVSPR